MMINRAPSTASSETLYCLGTTQDQLEMTQFSQQHKYFNDFSMFSFLEQPTQGFQGGLLLESGDDLLNELTMTRPIKAEPGLEPGWPDFRASATPAAMDDYSAAAAHGLVNYGISRTSSCPPASMGNKMRTETFRKRKADNKTLQPSKQEEAGDENRAKKSKGCCEEDELAPKKPDEHLSNSGNKENKMKEGLSGGSSSKASEAQKPDYIHVRARRGQATDSHSLAERVRREKISERMKYLQDLVPGCNKITGKAGMLDEIINYVQSLQRQVEFLSMKLAVVNPRLDFNIEDLFAKEVFSACSSNIPEMDMGNMAYLQYNSGQQTGPVCGSGFSVTEAEMGIQRTFSATVPIPEALPDSSSLTQLQSCLPWDQPDLQSIYNMEFQRASQPSFSTQTYTGPN